MGGLHEAVDIDGKLRDEVVVEGLFKRGASFARRDRLVLEGLELFRDVAFGVLEGLSARVTCGDVRRLRLRDFDVKALHAVVFDAQRRNARGLSFTFFEVDQEVPRMVAQTAQIHEFGMVFALDHVAVAQKRCGLFENRGVELLKERGVEPKGGRERRKGFEARETRRELVENGERIAKGGELLRAHALHGRTRRNALEVGKGLEQIEHVFAQRLVLKKGRNRRLTRKRLFARAKGVVEPLFQRTASHRRAAAVEDRKERGAARVGADRIGDLEVAPRGGVDHDRVGLFFDLQRQDEGEQIDLSFRGVIE